MSQKLVVASVPISITVFSLGSIIIRKTGLRIDCRVVYIIFLSYLFLFFSCFTIQSKRFLFSQTQSGIVLMKYDDIVVNVLPAPFPGFFEVRVFVQMAYLNVFLSCRFNMQKKNKNVTFVNYPHLKKQASEEDSLKIQASSPQALSFPAYPGDILRHVCKRDPVARQATPVFHR